MQQRRRLGAQFSRVISITAEIVSANIPNKIVSKDDLPRLIQSVFDKLMALADEEPTPVEPTPVVPIRKSVPDDYIVCLEDGKKLKMLKRHLKTAYVMGPKTTGRSRA